MRRKIIFLAALIIIGSDLFSQDVQALAQNDVPVLLNGIWQNRQRYVVFDTDYFTTQNAAIPQIVLRTFYTWWDDRAQEAEQYTKDKKDTFPRAKNNTTSKAKAQEISITFQPLTDELFPDGQNLEIQKDGFYLTADNTVSGAWDLQIKYPGIKEIYHVPVCVIGSNLYLNFVIKKIESEEDFTAEGFWQDYGASNGILISPPITKNELLSYYITEDAVYHIRYWRTDMDYDSETQAVFSDGSKNFKVPKHLNVGGKIYTCVTGKRTKIRNIEKSDSLPENYLMNSVKITTENEVFYGATICALGEPYLTLADGTRTLEEIIKIENARKKPAPEPLFPVHGGAVDFDFSIVERPPKDLNRRILDLGK